MILSDGKTKEDITHENRKNKRKMNQMCSLGKNKSYIMYAICIQIFILLTCACFL